MKVQYFKENEYIFKEGEIGNTFYLIYSGHVGVYQKKIQEYAGMTTEVVLATLHSGDSFGELALINDKPRAASVKALQATFCIILTKEMFKSAI